jgi:S1-C subfamily serine protease
MPALYGSQDLTPQQVFATVSPSIYLVLSGETPDSVEKGRGTLGSAVAVAPNWALTNCHVVSGQPFIAVIGERSEIFIATVARSDVKSDRCFLKVGGRLKAIAAVRSTDSLEVGERVYTIGNPSGLSKTLGEGLISGLRQHESVAYVQTAAPISPGSSGGALVDSKGALVGITTAFLKDAQNLNFAIAAAEYWR